MKKKPSKRYIKTSRDRIDLTNKRFGRLLVIKYVYTERKSAHWLCKCDCGNEHIVNGLYLRSGKTKSCGCLAREKARKNLIKLNLKHGESRTRFYRIWRGSCSRCNDLNNKNYGGRGIKCKWSCYEEFRNDMYKSYLEHCKKHGRKNTTLDRIDNDGDYCKGNCRWATYEVQASNKGEEGRYITFNKERRNIKEWSEKTGIKANTIVYRLKRGWSIKRALTENVL